MRVGLIFHFLFILNEISWVTLTKLGDNVHTWIAEIANAAIVHIQDPHRCRWWTYICRVSLKRRLNVF